MQSFWNRQRGEGVGDVESVGVCEAGEVIDARASLRAQRDHDYVLTRSHRQRGREGEREREEEKKERERPTDPPTHPPTPTHTRTRTNGYGALCQVYSCTNPGNLIFSHNLLLNCFTFFLDPIV